MEITLSNRPRIGLIDVPEPVQIRHSTGEVLWDMTDPDGPTRIVMSGRFAAIRHEGGRVLAHPMLTTSSLLTTRGEAISWFEPGELDAELEEFVGNIGAHWAAGIAEAQQAGAIPPAVPGCSPRANVMLALGGRHVERAREWDTLRGALDAYLRPLTDTGQSPDDVLLLPVTRREWAMAMALSANEGTRTPAENLTYALLHSARDRLASLGVTPTVDELRERIIEPAALDWRVDILAAALETVAAQWTPEQGLADQAERLGIERNTDELDRDRKGDS